MKRSSENGSALWFILLAIALLAALTLTITRVSDTTEQSGDTERARIFASDIMRFGVSVEKSIQQMQLRGISENEISFEGPADLTGYTNPNCGNSSCRVFDAEGGGLTYKKPSTDWLDPTYSTGNSYGVWWFSGSAPVMFVGSQYAVDMAQRCTGTGNPAACSELVIYLKYVSKAVCIQINNMLDVDNPGGNPPLDDSWGTLFDTTGGGPAKFVGSFGGSDDIGGLTASEPSGCYQEDTDAGEDFYVFYHTLLAR